MAGMEREFVGPIREKGRSNISSQPHAIKVKSITVEEPPVMSHVSKSSSRTSLFGHLHSARCKTPMLAAFALLSVVGGALLTGCGTGSGSNGNNNHTPASGTGTFTATFSNASGTNATTSAFTAGTVMPLTSSGAFTLLNVTGTKISGTSSRTFTLSLAESGPIQVGKSYPFASPSASTLTYTDTALATAHAWAATGGSATVDSITGKNYKIRIVNATFTTDADNTSGATGSYTVNGNVDATLP